ncbi:MAG: hypothetical protein WCH98_15715 [Verrucomicrobiota bacterium]
MKKIGQVVGRAMQKKTSRGVKRGKKTSGPLRAFAKSPYQHNQDEPVKPELQPVTTTSVFERLIGYRPDLARQLKDPRYAAEYLAQALASGDTGALKLAVRDFVEAMNPRTLRGKVLRRLYQLGKTTRNLSKMKTARLQQLLHELESEEPG